MADLIHLRRSASRWAVVHNGSTVGYAPSRLDAEKVGTSLIAWLDRQGRRCELVLDPSLTETQA